MISSPPVGAGCSVSLEALPGLGQLVISRSAKCFQALPVLPQRGRPLLGLHPPACIALWSQTLPCVRNGNKITMGMEKQPFYTLEMRGGRGSWGFQLPPYEFLLGKLGSAARKAGKVAAPCSWGRWREPEHPKAQPPPATPCEQRGPRSRAQPSRAASRATAARILLSVPQSKLNLLLELRERSRAPGRLTMTHTATEQHTQTRRAHTGHTRVALSVND